MEEREGGGEEGELFFSPFLSPYPSPPRTCLSVIPAPMHHVPSLCDGMTESEDSPRMGC